MNSLDEISQEKGEKDELSSILLLPLKTVCGEVECELVWTATATYCV